MKSYLGVVDTNGKILRDVTDSNGLPVVLTGSNPTQLTATIALGTSLAPAVDLAGKVLVGYIMPAAWTAANLTFQTSPDNVVAYSDIYDNTGAELSHVVAASHFIRVNPADWVGVRFLKLRSGVGALPVNQAAAASIILVTKAV